VHPVRNHDHHIALRGGNDPVKHAEWDNGSEEIGEEVSQKVGQEISEEIRTEADDRKANCAER
tara:strand:+ start:80 stop:268 length:189 start_codon:yes stop_codon:yes gene_type:complete